MKKEKVIWEMIGSVIILFYGCILLSSSWLQIDNLRTFLIIFFVLHGILKCMLFSRFEKDYINLLSGISSACFAIVNLLFDFVSNTKSLAFMLLIFTLIFALIKLKKADFFHDRKNKFWLIEVSSLFFFFIISILLSVNLFYPEDILCLLFGFYIFFLGLSEFYECLIFHLVKGKLK